MSNSKLLVKSKFESHKTYLEPKNVCIETVQ